MRATSVLENLTEFGTLSPDNVDQRMAEVRAAFFAIQDGPIPVVGAVRGAALARDWPSQHHPIS